MTHYGKHCWGVCLRCILSGRSLLDVDVLHSFDYWYYHKGLGVSNYLSLDDLPSKVGLYNHSFDTALLSLETKQLTRENEYSSFLQEVIESWGDLKRLLILISRATFGVTFAVRIIFCLIYTVETIKDFELCLLDQYYFSLLV